MKFANELIEEPFCHFIGANFSFHVVSYFNHSDAYLGLPQDEEPYNSSQPLRAGVLLWKLL